MDERKIQIREFEDKKRAAGELKNRFFEGLGEVLLKRIEDDSPFGGNSGDTCGTVLAEYRRLNREIDDSEAMIKRLEEDTVRLKELEDSILEKEKEKDLVEKELSENYLKIGRELLASDDNVPDVSKQQETVLLSKIEEQERKLKELREREGGIIAWLGKNAKMAVANTLLYKNRSALEKLYRATGEKYITFRTGSSLNGEGAFYVEKADEGKELLRSLDSGLSSLKTERRKIAAAFGYDGSPSRRIQGLERHITHVKAEFGGVYIRFGGIAAGNERPAYVSSLLSDDDRAVIAKADALQTQIDDYELQIEKLKTSLNIDSEKEEIEKLKKAIANQRHKIESAEETISDLEKNIGEAERRIEELEDFLRKN